MFPHENHRRRLRCVVYGGHRVPSSRLRSGCLLSFAWVLDQPLPAFLWLRVFALFALLAELSLWLPFQRGLPANGDHAGLRS